MAKKYSVVFSKKQLQFLAVLHLFKTPVPIDVVGSLTPLLPGPLFDLLRRGEGQGWLVKDADDCFQVTTSLPITLQNQIEEFITTDRVAQLLESIDDQGLGDRIDPTVQVALFIQAGRQLEAALKTSELAAAALNSRQSGSCADHLESLVSILSTVDPLPEEVPLFLNALLTASELCYTLGRFILNITPLLEKALPMAAKIGDLRSTALIHLHLGQHYYVSNRRSESLEYLSTGRSMVEELGDDDIMEQSLEFTGLYYFQQGLFAKAIAAFEQALQVSERDGNRSLRFTSVMLGFSAYYTGQFHRAIGVLDSHWHNAVHNDNPFVATAIRASLGIVLILIDKKQEALVHLKAAWEDALEQKNGWALWLAGGGLAIYHYSNNDYLQTRKIFEYYIAESEKSGIVEHTVSPLTLEVIDKYEREGHEPVPGYRFEDLCRIVLQETNVHMQGVALRLLAARNIAKKTADSAVLKDLQQSEAKLIRTGDPVQVAKTHVELARYYLLIKDTGQAKEYALRARRGLSEAIGDRFPDDLRFLLQEGSGTEITGEITDVMLENSFRLLEEMIPGPNDDELLQLLVSAMVQLFRAERCGLFQFPDEGGGTPVLQAAVNLFQTDVATDGFRANLAHIFDAYHSGRPLSSNPGRSINAPGQPGSTVVLCLPYMVDGKPRGVLYLENAYLNERFTSINTAHLDRFSEKLGAYIERIEAYTQFLKKARKSMIVQESGADPSDSDTMVSRNRSVNRMMSHAVRVAKTGATVLLTGETGVGKEVLARWIHRKSDRSRQGALIVIDPTTIPENLLESELFGHEKGAFTGAVTRKTGRLELAHGGTLFIDEIGEISPAIQVKLLRVLQEKSFIRVGGTKSIASDFRLLAATNRDLAAEVEVGRFRKDLYYRLNVMELRLPPLRERPEDILHLAETFLDRYASRHDRPGIRLTAEDESALLHYHWPGNIRELKNVMERAVLMSEQNKLELHLPGRIVPEHPHPFKDNPSFEEIQRRYISYVLEQTEGRIGPAAEILRMKRTTLYARIKKLGM